jgi:GH24 family phage-related lysozyme (muramidase)/LAS superfamily LD-carboxypeptidase LdcB
MENNTNNTSKIGCSVGVNRVKIIDPNQYFGDGEKDAYKNIPVNQEDLTVSVKLTTARKARTILFSSTEKTGDMQNSASSKDKVSVNFIGSTDINGKKFLTTKYTDLTTVFDKNVENDETLGITNIDIDFNSSYAPIVKIDFIDVRGSSVFQNEPSSSMETQNKYSTFFDLPYPLFELEIKGYYGRPVKYCLHMTKFNSRFNSATGNFEITCEFVGYTYAMLSDMLLGILKAIPYTDIGKSKLEKYNQDKKNKVITLVELINKINKINESIKKVAADSEESKVVNTYNEATQLLNDLKNVMISWAGFDEFNPKDVENIYVLRRNALTTSQNETGNKLNDNATEIIEKYNGLNIDGLSLKVEDFNKPLFYDDLTIKKIDPVNTDSLPYPSLSDPRALLSFKTSLYNYIKDSYSDSPISEETVFRAYDFRSKFETIEIQKSFVDKSIKDTNRSLAEKLKDEVTKDLGFEPTARNIIEIFTAMIEVFMESVYDVSQQASTTDTNNTRYELLDSVFGDFNSFKTDIKLNDKNFDKPNYYPWPLYSERNTSSEYVEKYLGTNQKIRPFKQQIPELKFVEDLLKGFIASAKEELQNEQNYGDEKIFYPPTNPADTLLFITENYKDPYSRNESIDVNDVFRNLLIRATTFFGYTNNPEYTTDDEIKKFAELEANSIIRGLTNQKLIPMISQTVDKDSILKATGTIDDVSRKVLEVSGDDYYYNYYFDSDNIDGIKILPMNSDLNNKTLADDYDTARKTLEEEKIIFLTNYNATAQINSITDKSNDGGIYVKFFTDEEYNVSGTLAEGSATVKTVLDYKSLIENPASAGFNAFGGPFGIQDITSIKFDGKAGPETESPISLLFYNQIESTYDLNSYFFGKTREASNDGKTIVSIYDYDVKKTKTYIRGANDTSKKDLFQPDGFLLHDGLNKNRTLLNDVLKDTGNISVPYIQQSLASPFRPLRVVANIPFTYEQRTDAMFSLFGSKFYYLQQNSKITYQNTNNQTVNISGEKYAKALLFLNTLPFEQGFNGPLDDAIDIPAIVKLFSVKSGFVHVPRLWAAYIGGLFWRGDSNAPIIDSDSGNIIGGGSGTSDLIVWWKSCTGDYQPNEREEFQRGPRSYLPKNFRIIGVKYPFFDDYHTPTNSDLIKSIPDQVKEEFKKVFLNFVNGEGGYTSFDLIREGLEIKKDTDNANEFCKILVKMIKFNSDGGYVNLNYKDKNSDSYVLTTNIKNSFKNLENYNIVSPLPIHFQNIFSESNSSIRKLRINTDAMFLELKDTSTTMTTLLNALKENLVMANNSYNIWLKDKYEEASTSRHSITIPKSTMSTYLDKFIAVFKENTKNFSTTGQEEKLLNDLFGTANRDEILLMLYKHCKNIYDKWIGGVTSEDKLIFQCGENDNPNSSRNTIDKATAKKYGYENPRLIDSFRFVSRSFKDIGDIFYINPLPLKEQIKNVPNTSAYNAISGLLNDNKFDFIALPTFINFYDDKVVEDMFKPHTSVNTVETCGPSFVCVYVGQKSNRLDINGSKYENDGFDFRCGADESKIPDDFKNSLPTTDAEGIEIGNYEQPLTVFQVKYSQQNQNIFKDITLDQSEFTETEESLQIIQQIADKGSETDRLFMGQNIYNVYAIRSYKTEIEMMGNAMIQPMMYFQLDNIPMFHGAYMITKTKHNIKPNYMSTSFTGVRIRAVETPLIDVVDAYMNLIESLNLSEGQKAKNVIVSGSQPPIVRTIVENQGANGEPFRNNIAKGTLDISDIKKIKFELSPNPTMIKEAIEPLKNMIKDWFVWIEDNTILPKTNKNYAYITSVFRSYADQVKTKASYGDDAAEPGSSRHGWGIAVDFQYFDAKGEVISNKSNVRDYFNISKNPSIKWLYDNSYKYGYYLPYELRNGGTVDEHWHWEYHGKSAACLWRKYPKIFNYTLDVKNILDNKVKEFVHNPKGKDGNEANYGTDCSFTIVNNADGTGVTSKAYPNVNPAANELKMVENLSGDWVNRAKQMIITFEGYLKKAKWDGDAYRGGYGSDIKLNNNGVPEKVKVTTTFTQKEAEDALMYNIRNDYSNRVKNKLGASVWNNLNNNRKAALVSYAYNVGSIRNSIANFIKANDFKSASEAIFNEPITGKGVGVLDGLIRRRKIESKVFDKSV